MCKPGSTAVSSFVRWGDISGLYTGLIFDITRWWSVTINYKWTDAVAQRCSVKKVLLQISKNSQENTCARVSSFNKVAGLMPATLLKKRLWHRCFPVNFSKFLRTPFLQNTSGRLLPTMRNPSSQWKDILINNDYVILKKNENTWMAECKICRGKYYKSNWLKSKGKMFFLSN